MPQWSSGSLPRKAAASPDRWIAVDGGWALRKGNLDFRMPMEGKPTDSGLDLGNQH